MEYPRYIATYCVMDGDAGSNLFWHACFLISKQENADSPLEVIRSVGFYPSKSTSKNPAIRFLKFILGFKEDLQNTHGVLKEEEIRYLDKKGLWGINFDLDKNSFNRVEKIVEEKFTVEKEAIEHWNSKLGKNANGCTRLAAEINEAKLENREPRLSPFHITMSLNADGLDTSKSSTCKNYVLNILKKAEIINDKTEQQILGSKSNYAFPRGSKGLRPIQLTSVGPAIKNSKEKLYRDWGYRLKLSFNIEPKTVVRNILYLYLCNGHIYYKAIKNRKGKYVEPKEISQVELGEHYDSILAILRGNKTIPLTPEQEGAIFKVTSKENIYQRGHNKLYWAVTPPCSTEQEEKYSEVYPKIKGILESARNTEESLYKNVTKESTNPAATILAEKLGCVENIYSMYSEKGLPPEPRYFETINKTARDIINSVNKNLMQYKAYAPFLLRAYQSISLKFAIFGLIGLIIGASLITSPVGIAITAVTAAVVLTGASCFFNSEYKMSKIRDEFKSEHDLDNLEHQAPASI